MFCSLCQSANSEGATQCQKCGGPMLGASTAYSSPLARAVPAAAPVRRPLPAADATPGDVFSDDHASAPAPAPLPPATPPRPSILVSPAPAASVPAATPPPPWAGGVSARPVVVIQPARVATPVAAPSIFSAVSQAVVEVKEVVAPLPEAAPAPVVAPPAPVLAAPVPVLAAPVPVLAAPVPVLAAPVPVVAAPVPVVAAPAPIVPAPAPVDDAAAPDTQEPRVVRAATWVHKGAAALVDLAISGALTLGYAVVEFLEMPEAEQDGPVVALSGVDWFLDAMSRHAGLLGGMFVAITLAVTVYETLAVALMGRTLGQKVVGVRLVSMDGRKPGAGRGAVRGLLAGLGLMVAGAGWLWAPFDKRRAGLHDKWTGLVMVEEPPAPVPVVPPGTLPPVDGMVSVAVPVMDGQDGNAAE